MKEVIKTYNLSKKYGNYDALLDVNINVKQGDIYGLVGDNGAGKTTLFRILSGQSHASSGSFELFSVSDEKELNEVRKHTGVIIESPSFYPNLTVEKIWSIIVFKEVYQEKTKLLKLLKMLI